MSGVLHNWIPAFVAMLLIGGAVKLMDDFLDSEYDICRGERTVAVKLGRAALPYGLLCVLLAAYLDVRIALTVFLASYVLGMLTNWRESLPTRVPAYVEMVIAVLLMVGMVGWQLSLWGLSFLAMIDWLDDVIDVRRDERTGQRNIAHKIGLVETTLLILVAMCVAVLTNTKYTALGFVAFAILSALAEVTTSHLWSGDNEMQGRE